MMDSKLGTRQTRASIRTVVVHLLDEARGPVSMKRTNGGDVVELVIRIHKHPLHYEDEECGIMTGSKDLH